MVRVSLGIGDMLISVISSVSNVRKYSHLVLPYFWSRTSYSYQLYILNHTCTSYRYDYEFWYDLPNTGYKPSLISKVGLYPTLFCENPPVGTGYSKPISEVNYIRYWLISGVECI